MKIIASMICQDRCQNDGPNLCQGLCLKALLPSLGQGMRHPVDVVLKRLDYLIEKYNMVLRQRCRNPSSHKRWLTVPGEDRALQYPLAGWCARPTADPALIERMKRGLLFRYLRE